ncbi:uncharacterized protein LOC133815087 [Humulus lupulus]|uniref:uncharacterized protein LOC133815087 n=1 Tax=Humulus lupulus TaxID=3486 RepID=UPI002B40AB91|nr:uncharacterized protein LOC133815087 [Humulus lupulus]
MGFSSLNGRDDESKKRGGGALGTKKDVKVIEILSLTCFPLCQAEVELCGGEAFILNQLHNGPRSVDNIKKIRERNRELNKFLTMEELFWKQRAQTKWLAHGDCNTKFFQRKACSRKKRNEIKGLENSRGVWCEELRDITTIVEYYFSNHFSSNGVDATAVEMTTSNMVTVMSDELNRDLMKPFDKDEIQKASKAPKSNGLHAIFYPKNLGHCEQGRGLGLFECAQQWDGDGDLNKTNMVLIPKVTSPCNILEFRSISLCNVIYKVISKAIANRFKLALSLLVWFCLYMSWNRFNNL